MRSTVNAITLRAAQLIAMGLVTLGWGVSAESQNAYQVHEGYPAGGVDLCTGQLFGCLQFFVTLAENVIAQGKRQISVVGGRTDAGTYSQWRDCITAEKMGDLFVRAYDSVNATTRQRTCVSDQVLWRNYGVTATLQSKVDADFCDAYTDGFKNIALSCESFFGAVGKGLILALEIGGAALGVILLAAAGYCLKQKWDKCCASRGEREPLDVPLRGLY